MGINMIIPPRDDLVPGDLVIADNDRSARRASWGPVLGADPSRIVVHRNPVKSFDFKVSDKLDTRLTASLLGKILSTLGLTEARLSSALKASGCDRVSLKLIAPAQTGLADFDGLLAQLRAEATPQPAYEGRRLFVVQSCWRAKGISLEMLDSSNRLVSLNAEAEQLLKAELSASLSKDASGRYAFTASTPLIFGIEVRELDFAGGLITDKPVDTPLKFRTLQPGSVFLETEDDSAFIDLGAEEPV